MMKTQTKWPLIIFSSIFLLFFGNTLLTRNLPQNTIQTKTNAKNIAQKVPPILSWTSSSNEGEANFWPLIIIELILITLFAVMIILKRRELKKAGIKFLALVPLIFADEVVPKGGLVIILVLGLILLFEVIYLSYLSLISSRHAAEG